MLGHVMGNDPRPHYFHQTNIAAVRPGARPTPTRPTGGTLYAVVNTLLNRYDASIDRASDAARPAQPGRGGQDARPPERLGGRRRRRPGHRATSRTARCTSSRRPAPRCRSPAPPTARTTPARRSGWTTVGGARLGARAAGPRNTAAPAIAGAAATGATLTASRRHVGGHRHDRHDAASGSAAPPAAPAWTNIAGATGRDLRAPGRRRGQPPAGRRLGPQLDLLRQPGGLRGHGRGGQAGRRDRRRSTTRRPTEPAGDQPAGDATRRSTTRRARRPRLSRVRLRSPRVRASAGRADVAQGAARTLGSTISWSLDRAATVRLTVQRRAG